ncbi:nucleic acid dioxygenase ALKBH1-like [Penaeus chinensis]|uniref:nucleic acid dioxygenase ALKBH1-like n=1 Tax=Penaeus chinensis TaxID=139456 RepID=UPI001FB83ADC|nr:nucleic acid dioxygenase ALKBH1-like [Penaeus chinensis]XP_047477599.1 nucleic acid dioxygenase ALKBH1-like [Penaeus chinensis]XP_047477600.1 nucleic acid dioxygenase ALKBH1-like [Penaeus chinensis]
MAEGCHNADTNEDKFKPLFRYYKRRQPPPDYCNVLQVGALKAEKQIPPCSLTPEEQEQAKEVGLVPYSTWKIYALESHPGLMIVLNPFTSQGQQEWIKRCLMDYPCSPNKTNLISHGIDLGSASWWDLAHSPEGDQQGLQKMLRWVTLGYHHNWDTKEYSEDMKGDIPLSLQILCRIVAKVVGFDSFRAEAAIVNYYHKDSTLAPHTDHSEPNMEAPLLSFSFGQSAVFLIGGPSKSTEPSALFLHSGDIMIMSGASRKGYHAVPRIRLVPEEPWNAVHEGEGNLPSEINRNQEGDVGNERCDDNCPFNKRLKLNSDSDDEQRIVKMLEYIRTNRINMNVRQVLMPGMDKLER